VCKTHSMLKPLKDNYAGSTWISGRGAFTVIAPKDRQQVVDSLGGPSRTRFLLSIYLLLPRKWAPYRAEGATVLGGCGSAAEPGLLALLADEDAQVRANALWALRGLEDVSAQVIPAVTGMLDEPDVFNRFNAACLLGKLGQRDLNAKPKLTKMLADEVSGIRLAAAYALMRMYPDAVASPQLQDVFLGGLKDQDNFTKCQAAFFLQDLGPAASFAVSVLSEGAGRDGGYQIPAINALGAIGLKASGAVPVLEKLLDNDVQRIRQAAAEALKKIRAADKKEEPPRGPAPAGAQEKEVP